MPTQFGHLSVTYTKATLCGPKATGFYLISSQWGFKGPCKCVYRLRHQLPKKDYKNIARNELLFPAVAMIKDGGSSNVPEDLIKTRTHL